MAPLPPGQIQKHSWYPALPLLRDYFSDDVVILMDDAVRPNEKAIVGMWTREFPEFEHGFIQPETGAAVLRRTQ